MYSFTLGAERRHDAFDELEDALMLLRMVDADGLELVGQQVPQQLAYQALLAIDDRRRVRRLHALADLEPDLVECLEVADDVFLGPAAGGRADDDAAREAVRLAELAHDAAQPASFLARLDLPGDADVIDRRHEDQKAPRHGDVRREARALGAERLLDDLDEDLLALLEEVLDPRLRTGFVSRPVLAGTFFVARFELVELLERVHDVGDVQEPVALEAEVDERRLHAGQDLADPALVDVADDSPLPLAFDEDFGGEIVLENGHHGFVAVGGDDHLLGHSRTPWAGSGRKLWATGRCSLLPSEPVQPCQPG